MAANTGDTLLLILLLDLFCKAGAMLELRQLLFCAQHHRSSDKQSLALVAVQVGGLSTPDSGFRVRNNRFKLIDALTHRVGLNGADAAITGTITYTINSMID